MTRLLLTIRLFAAALLSGAALASCDGVALTDELPPSPPTVGTLPISFAAAQGDAWPDPTSRAGELTTNNLLSMGVFASYTGTSWNASVHTPNFMYNQKVTRKDASTAWTYTPLKYWPNTPGEKISFFAYAPASDQVPGLVVSSAANAVGYPILDYTVPTAATAQTDLLAAVPLTNKTQSTAPLSFTMKHVMTRILVKAKCTEKIEIKNVQLNKARAKGRLTLNANPAWGITDATPTSFTHAASTTVLANTTTSVAEFFMLPHMGESISVTFTLAGKEEIKTAPLPTIQWTQGKSIAYTLNIEVGSEITLTVKGWEMNSSNNGNMGQEVPSGTNYPYIMNGVLYETATKSYYLGEIKENWWSWDYTMNYCKNTYSAGPFPAREWRLPNKAELSKIVETKDVITDKHPIWTTSYWTSEEYGTDAAWYGWGRPVQFGTRKKGDGIVTLCIRDMGEITVYPTYRIKDGYEIIHINANTTLGFDRVDGWYLYQAAVNRCTGLRDGGYSDWRLPTRSELELLKGIGELKTGVIWSSTPASSGNVWVYHNGNNAFQPYATTGTWADGSPYCVRSF